jgi:hypothetical protein
VATNSPRSGIVLSSQFSVLNSPRSKCLVSAITLLLLASLPSCSDQTKRTWRFRSASENYRLALEAPNADDRRDAVASIGESGYVTSADAFGVLDAVARTDASQHVRCVAVSAFSRYQDDRPAATVLAILQATPDKKTEALPPNGDLREAAASVLADLCARGQVSDAQRETARDIFIKSADSDSPRPVRIVALRALGGFLDRRVLAPLVKALREQDFAIADAGERSLIALTGRTHDYDADAWEKWLANTQDPFAHAGEKVVTTRPAGPSWWERQQKKWRDMRRRRDN